jgi:2-polyprenyl-3-methyl-5-hydroxy-6-metoxy-1,4-benzoquinol methylase
MGIEYITLDTDELPDTHEFDMVMLNGVLEHLHDSPRDLLNDLLERVRERGYLYITVANHVNLRKRIVLRGKTSHPQYEQYYWYPWQVARACARIHAPGLHRACTSPWA